MQILFVPALGFYLPIWFLLKQSELSKQGNSVLLDLYILVLTNLDSRKVYHFFY